MADSDRDYEGFTGPREITKLTENELPFVEFDRWLESEVVPRLENLEIVRKDKSREVTLSFRTPKGVCRIRKVTAGNLTDLEVSEDFKGENKNKRYIRISSDPVEANPRVMIASHPWYGVFGRTVTPDHLSWLSGLKSSLSGNKTMVSFNTVKESVRSVSTIPLIPLPVQTA